MGLGKTISTLTALDGLFLAGEDQPALVLAPLRVARTTWPEEARKWQHLRHVSVMPIVGNEAERRMAVGDVLAILHDPPRTDWPTGWQVWPPVRKAHWQLINEFRPPPIPP